MCDFMINHISAQSEEFKDYMKNKDGSRFRDMFIRWNEFWNGEPSEEDVHKLYFRKMSGPVKEYSFDDGNTVKLWNTFGPEQIDLNPYAPVTQEYFKKNLEHLAQYVPLIRFDAVAYASKRPGTSCFFVEPEIWDVLKIGTEPLKKTGTEMLSEIHENYIIQLKMAEKGYWVYDFALPMLLLHGLMSGRTDRLINWLKICPKNQFTTLDTHDGIGVVDVTHLLEEDEIDFVCGRVAKKLVPLRQYQRFPMGGMIKQSGQQKMRRYQLNITYYSALNEDDDAYLLSRIVQFYTPGIPQVYYVGLMAGENDVELMKQGGDHRNINRHYYTREEIAETVKKPMLQRMYRIMRFRNKYPAFNGDIKVEENVEPGKLDILWIKDEYWTRLNADFTTKEYTITYYNKELGKAVTL
jgi:sucrose phosphorylase